MGMPSWTTAQNLPRTRRGTGRDRGSLARSSLLGRSNVREIDTGHVDFLARVRPGPKTTLFLLMNTASALHSAVTFAGHEVLGCAPHVSPKPLSTTAVPRIELTETPRSEKPSA